MGRILVVVTVLCTLAGTAAAKVHELPIGGVTLDVPKKWKVKPTEKGLFLETRDGVVKLSIYHVEGNDLAKEWADHLTWAAGLLTDGVLGADQEEVIGALTGRAIRFTGKRDGKPASAILALLATPRGHQVSMLVSTIDAKVKKHRKDLDKVLASLAGRPHRIDDEAYRALFGFAQAFVEKLATIIEKNDKKGFVAVGGAGLAEQEILKAKKLTTLLGLATSGGWHVAVEPDGTTMWMWRGGVSVDIPMLKIVLVDGAMRVTEIGVRPKPAEPAAEPAPEPAAPAVDPVGGWCLANPADDYEFCDAAESECLRVAENWKNWHDLTMACGFNAVLYCETNQKYPSCYSSKEACERKGRGGCAAR